jgi:hypothetical protein
MATEKKDENDEQVEQVEQFKTLSKKINDKSSRSEMITMLVSFFEYENYDILQLVKDCITLDDYDLLLGRVGKAGNVILIERITKWLTENVPDFDTLHCRALVSMALQEGHHYSKGLLCSLESIITPTKERIEAAKSSVDITANEYCHRVRGIIFYESNDTWNSLKKMDWDVSMYRFFYYSACQAKNGYVVEQIEKAIGVLKIGWQYKILKNLMFSRYDELKKAIKNASCKIFLGGCSRV